MILLLAKNRLHSAKSLHPFYERQGVSPLDVGAMRNEPAASAMQLKIVSVTGYNPQKQRTSETQSTEP